MPVDGCFIIFTVDHSRSKIFQMVKFHRGKYAILCQCPDVSDATYFHFVICCCYMTHTRINCLLRVLYLFA